jgi:hypothetical protein
MVLQQAPDERLGNAFEHGRPLITRSFEQLLRRKFDIVGYLVWSGWHVRSTLAVVRIVPDTTDLRIRPCPYRIEGLAVRDAALRADEMSSHLPHRRAPRQPQNLGIEIEVPVRPAVAAVNLQQLPLPDQVANGHGLEVGRLWLTPAPGLVPVLLQLHKLRKAGDQLGDPAGLI